MIPGMYTDITLFIAYDMDGGSALDWVYMQTRILSKW